MMDETDHGPEPLAPLAHDGLNGVPVALAPDPTAPSTQPVPANPEPDGLARPRPSASEALARRVRKNLAGPALVFPGTLVRRMLREKRGKPCALLAPVPREDHMPPWCPLFQVGPLSHETPETAHRHALQDELYIVLRGRIRIHCWLGSRHALYAGGPGTAILVPRGSTHMVEWETPGWGYAIKAPHVFGEAAKQVVE